MYLQKLKRKELRKNFRTKTHLRLTETQNRYSNLESLKENSNANFQSMDLNHQMILF